MKILKLAAQRNDITSAENGKKAQQAADKFMA